MATLRCAPKRSGACSGRGSSRSETRRPTTSSTTCSISSSNASAVDEAGVLASRGDEGPCANVSLQLGYGDVATAADVGEKTVFVLVEQDRCGRRARRRLAPSRVNCSGADLWAPMRTNSPWTPSFSRSPPKYWYCVRRPAKRSRRRGSSRCDRLASRRRASFRRASSRWQRTFLPFARKQADGVAELLGVGQRAAGSAFMTERDRFEIAIARQAPESSQEATWRARAGRVLDADLERVPPRGCRGCGSR